MQHSLTTINSFSAERQRTNNDFDNPVPSKGGFAKEAERLIDREARTLSPWWPDEEMESEIGCCCEACADSQNWRDYREKEETRDA